MSNFPGSTAADPLKDLVSAYTLEHGWVNLFREDYNGVSEKDEKRRVKLPNKSANCSIGGKGVYQPSEEELAEAVAILVECGAARQVDAIGPSGSSSGTWNLALNFGL